MSKNVNLYFSDFFKIDPTVLEEYGAFNISLVNDLPLFIDPFLLFNSKKNEYSILHDKIIEYLYFLKGVASPDGIKLGLLKNWFYFPEIRQNWLGYSRKGNKGSGLGQQFASALNENLHHVFSNFGSEEITKGSHLEKLCLIKDGVGRDNISDFVTNLIKDYLLLYTEKFSKLYLDQNFVKEHLVKRVQFNYQSRSWEHRSFCLPTFKGNYILLTPKDILTKDNTWINKDDMVSNFELIADSIPNEELRAKVNEYLLRFLSAGAKKKDRERAVTKTIIEYPECIDYYIKHKEETGDMAQENSYLKVGEVEEFFITQMKNFVNFLSKNTLFYEKFQDTFEEAYQRVIYLKQVIENNDGYRFFYAKDGNPMRRESDLHIFYRLIWFGTISDLNSEVNNGRGQVDFTISRGNNDKTLVEFKLAKNSKLKSNLQKQLAIYEAANQTRNSISVIFYFTDRELERVEKVLRELKLKQCKTLVLIDARPDNKPSGSCA